MFKDLETYYGTLEWNQDQMAFHFSSPSEKVDGWDTVIENISFDMSSAFIEFLNYNWKERQKLPASEIRKMFDVWMLTRKGEVENG